ncbi:ABC transporter permease subunit [Actinoplanes sp. NPDC051513]|uniref:ABC transporter permease subunit n=1 Tax=Actinoplanes sp. NPDC051513 TaxID=3363908 RepID=UPI0037B6DC96
MIWLTWRQFRTQAVVGFVAAAAIAVVFLVTRGALIDLARDMGYTGCTTDCGTFADQFVRQAQKDYFGRLMFAGSVLLFVLPVLIGLFWGAPLVARELETGTHRLVWNQTVSRNRWLAVKLGGVGLATVAVAGLISWAFTAWASPLDKANGWMTPDIFTVRGVVPIGYAAFGFLAGVTIGMLLRRTVAAMAVTLVVVGVAMFLVIAFLRPHLVEQTTYTGTLTAESIGGISLSPGDADRDIRVEPEAPVEGAWVLSNVVVNASGVAWHGPYDPQFCGPGAPGDGPQGCARWIASQDLKQKVIYLGADKFWALQWRELGVLVGVSALLAIFCFWWIRRRVA